MGVLPETLFGYDVDYLFAYPTQKFVTIQDARLGLFKYFCTFGIFCYVGIYQIWYQCSYLLASPVQGAVRFTLQQPTKNGCDPTDAGCKNDFNSVYNLPYCTQYTGPESYPNGRQSPCMFLENIGAQQVMDKSILITTRQTSYEQVLACNITEQPSCPNLYNETSTATKYVVDSEYFTVLVDHSVIATAFEDVKYASSELKGRLFVQDNEGLCKDFKKTATADSRGEYAWSPGDGPCYIAPNTTSSKLDFFSLDVIMRAAGATLDDANTGGATFRYTGATMLLEIMYENIRFWKGSGTPYYYYKPMLVKKSSYKFYSAEYEAYRTQRTLLNRHGIFIEAVQGGVIRQYSFNTLLIQLTVSLSLFATATVLTDFAALYLLPDAKHYEKFKYELTEDMGDLRAREEAEAAAREGGGRASEEGDQSGSGGYVAPLLVSEKGGSDDPIHVADKPPMGSPQGVWA